MNLLRNGLLMRKTGDRLRTELTEIFAFLCGFPAEFITRSSLGVFGGDCGLVLALRLDLAAVHKLQPTLHRRGRPIPDGLGPEYRSADSHVLIT
jgi:hypothetical protein